MDPRARTKDKVIIKFETKEARDLVKGQAHNLAQYGEEAGMRLYLPNYLQKDFRLLMKLAYIMKKKHTSLKRNIKFDEDTMGLFMDIQHENDRPWRRVKPEHAKKAIPAQEMASGPREMGLEDLKELLDAEPEGTD